MQSLTTQSSRNHGSVGPIDHKVLEALQKNDQKRNDLMLLTNDSKLCKKDLKLVMNDVILCKNDLMLCIESINHSVLPMIRCSANRNCNDQISQSQGDPCFCVFVASERSGRRIFTSPFVQDPKIWRMINVGARWRRDQRHENS